MRRAALHKLARMPCCPNKHARTHLRAVLLKHRKLLALEQRLAGRTVVALAQRAEVQQQRAQQSCRACVARVSCVRSMPAGAVHASARAAQTCAAPTACCSAACSACSQVCKGRCCAAQHLRHRHTAGARRAHTSGAHERSCRPCPAGPAETPQRRSPLAGGTGGPQSAMPTTQPSLGLEPRPLCSCCAPVDQRVCERKLSLNAGNRACIWRGGATATPAAGRRQGGRSWPLSGALCSQGGVLLMVRRKCCVRCTKQAITRAASAKNVEVCSSVCGWW
jgi:hypothetical protein